MNVLIRTTHRRLSMIFVGGILLNVVLAVISGDEAPGWAVAAAVLPLGLLLLTGLYLFALPYATRWRRRRAGRSGTRAA